MLLEWVIGLLFTLEPRAEWASTYGDTADAIATVAEESPLWRGPDGPRRTAALLVATSWFESTLNPRAVGALGEVCLFQIHPSNFAALGVTGEELLSSPLACTRAAVKLMAQSMRVCRREKPEHALAHFAAGKDGCREPGFRPSRHRMGLAARLLETP